ncbi:MAG: hypothetical protein PWR20_1586 [Bacteroidales bacterium]|jgi:biotin carboxyl carrier protein|nr:hypothetical protein [Bacteroidales bacterium]MDN5330721.1 hypothetical protein [Bacteroidales bacterium]NLH51805.1 biotin/lipoyl-binding protein [Bacteroidales bacterium]NPV36576.1 biotin/lipoyl-binding protein [Bacteroidales bacterium]
MEIKINNRTVNIELVSREGNLATVILNGKTYQIDILRVQPEVYSVLLNGLSYNVEVIPGRNARNFQVNTYRYTYDLEVIDAEARYLAARNKGKHLDGEKSIVAPMPGKVVKVLAEPGMQVKAGETLIIISAMKMESEFKAKTEGTVKAVNVKEGDAVESRQVLIVIE